MTTPLDFLLLALSQFFGGPGPTENNLVRFGLAAIMWGMLLIVAWSRQRSQDLPREKLLVWGFALGLARELFMLARTADRMTGAGGSRADTAWHPLEQALAMAAIVVVAGAFLRYVLDDSRVSRRYLAVGLGTAAVCFLITSWTWPRSLAANPELNFHQTWHTWAFQLPSAMLTAVALLLLRKEGGWLSRVVTVALGFFLVSQVLTIVNFATNRAFSPVLCPISNGFYILAIPLLGYVYLREQSLEKQRAEEALGEYRDHLEVLVEERTSDLSRANERLRLEIFERAQAENALANLSRRNQLILESTGEGICGIDQKGRCVFANPAAASMLGRQVEELLGQPIQALWPPQWSEEAVDGEEPCPICLSYEQGLVAQGDNLVFGRHDGTTFPVRYMASPTYENEELTGAVLVFRDITDRKRDEAELAQRNARLAAQNAVAATLSRSLDLDMILNTALDTVLPVLGMDAGFIFLVEPATQELILRVYRGRLTLDELAASEPGTCQYVAISDEAISSTGTIQLTVSDGDGTEDRICPLDDELPTLVSTPLVVKGQTIGALTLGASDGEPVDQPELELLTALGQQIGMAIENARLYQNAEHWAAELSQLHKMSVAVTSTLDPHLIHQAIAEQSTILLGCPAAAICLTGVDGAQLRVVASHGLDLEQTALMQRADAEVDPWLELMAQRQPIAIADARSDARVPRIWQQLLGLQALLFLPIAMGDELMAYLLLMDPRAARQWQAEEIELVQNFVTSGAVALKNAYLHHQLERAAMLEERQRIAANMHDGLAQTLSLLGLRVDQAISSIGGGNSAGMMRELNQVREVVGRAAVDVRRSIFSLRSPPEPRRSLQRQVRELLDKTIVDNGLSLDLVDEILQPIFLHDHESAQVLRIVQEALLNAQRHSQARNVTVFLRRGGTAIQITVRDDGKGFDPSESCKLEGHFGLSIMRARASQIGGSLYIDSVVGQGTSVTLDWWPATDQARQSLDDHSSGLDWRRWPQSRLPDPSLVGA